MCCSSIVSGSMLLISRSVWRPFHVVFFRFWRPSCVIVLFSPVRSTQSDIIPMVAISRYFFICSFWFLKSAEISFRAIAEPDRSFSG